MLMTIAVGKRVNPYNIIQRLYNTLLCDQSLHNYMLLYLLQTIMAQQQQDSVTPTIGFKSIQLLKTQTLGIGSYGSVCKALCDDLLCAAKIIHPTLFDPNAHQQIERQREHRLPISRFMQECEFMRAINHPNIVQFLGTCQDPETHLPVLLMELMDDSLTHFLESLQEAVPYHIQVNFCHDITKAISYLHSNGITHRDLSSNNVLLYGNVKAKVTDFGMAKLGDINHQATRISFTTCPGTDVYMPPEAVKDKPAYTKKIDCFSIGILIIQILTRCFPEPGERLKTLHTTDPRFPTIEARVSEIERRQNHISQVDPNHPLLPIALHCLKDSDVERPSAQELCHRVAALKETPQFTESVRRTVNPSKVEIKKKTQQIQILQQTIGLQNKCLQEKDNIIQEKEQTIAASQKECQQLRETIRDKDRQIEESYRQIQHITQELEAGQQVTAQFQTRIEELEQQVMKKSPKLSKSRSSLQDTPQIRISSTSGDNFTLTWREAKKAPLKMNRVPNAIVDGDTLYFCAAGSRKIYAYKSTNETWKRLPDCENVFFSLEIINNFLTTIGGRSSSGKVTNQLFSLTWEGKSKKWQRVFQSMPTKRSASATVCSEKSLVVAGGRDQDWKELRTVEVMDLATHEWASVADLLEPLSHASATICRDRIYLLGGWSGNEFSKSVYTCTLTDLLETCWSRSITNRLVSSISSISLARSTGTWNVVAELPLVGSTCVTLYGQLLAIGGRDSTDTPTFDVHVYHPTSNTWEAISKMKVSRRLCFVAVLPTNELMVVGGYTTRYGDIVTDSVEIATVV